MSRKSKRSESSPLNELYVVSGPLGSTVGEYQEYFEEVALKGGGNLIYSKRGVGKTFFTKDHPELIFPLAVYLRAQQELFRILLGLESE